MSDNREIPTGGQVAGISAAPFRIAVTGDFEHLALQAAPWASLGPSVEVVSFPAPFRSAHETVEALRDFDAITLMHERIVLSASMLAQLPRLKLIIFSGRKNEALDDQAAAARDIVVCRSHPDFSVAPPGGRSPSELTVALLMSCTWQTGRATELIRAGGWAFQPGIALRGKTLGIVGYGGVGRPVARVAQALGMRVLAFARSLTEDGARAEHVTRADLTTLLEQSDVVSVHLTLNSATRGMIGAPQIARMKPGVIFINTARAAIVEEAPFLDALRSGKIAMAGLDVFWEEPLPADHPLTRLPNVVLTPHLGYSTRESMIVRYSEQLKTLIAYRQGQIIGRYSSKAPA